MPIQTFSTFNSNLTPNEKEQLLHYFDDIYECNELSDHEYKISYLAYLWKNNCVYLTDSGYEIANEKELGITPMDYEITFEAESSSGVNLSVMYSFYGIDRLMDLV